MQVKGLIETFDFHDSNVIELFHEKDIVRIKIDLCMWKQAGYKEGDDELKEISLEFDAVENYIWDAEKAEEDIEYDTILEMSYSDGTLKIVLVDNGVTIISFKCNEVKIWI